MRSGRKINWLEINMHTLALVRVVSEVKTIMHLDSFDNFAFQLWPMCFPQLGLCFHSANMAGLSPCLGFFPLSSSLHVFVHFDSRVFFKVVL